jgi:WD40 repeat protein/serine/threonine protein kinase
MGAAMGSAMGGAGLTALISGRSIVLDKKLASSGEGTVWTTNFPGFLAKLYHTPTLDRMEKLRVMIAHPPQNPMRHHHHVTFAWPQDLLQDAQGQCLGFLMPEIVDGVKLSLIYNAKLRNRKAPRFNWYYLHTAALNFALSLKSLHDEGYVVGDIKPQNLLVNSRALISVIDADSFQVRDPLTQALYRCPVGSEGFTPVELLGKELSTLDQTEIHDRFRLGVMVFMLLFGDQPFKGKWIGRGESPQPAELIRQGYWPYAPKSMVQPGPNTIPLSIIHPQLQVCFQRCFTEGHGNPLARPSAHDWSEALKLAIPDLRMCHLENNHYYSRIYGRCYWCDRRSSVGLDVFSPTLATPRVKPPARKISPAASARHPQSASISSLMGIGAQGQSSLQRAATTLLNPMVVKTSQSANAWVSRSNPVLWGAGCIAVGLLGLAILLLPDLNVEMIQKGGTTLKTLLTQGFQSRTAKKVKSKLKSLVPPADSQQIAEVQHGGHWDTITALDLSIDNQLLISGSKDMTIKLWEFPSGELKQTFSDHYEPIVSVGISDNKQSLVTSSVSGKILVWDLKVQELMRSLPTNNAWGLEGTIRTAVTDRRGQIVASSGWGGSLLLQDLQSGRVIRIPSNSLGSEQALGMFPNGKTVISSSSDGKFQLWDTATGKLTKSFSSTGNTSGSSFESISALVLSLNGRVMVSGSWDGSILVWDVLTGTLQKQLLKQSKAASVMAVSDSGDRLAIANANEPAIKIWNTRTGQSEGILLGNIGIVTALKFSHDGQYLISGSDEPAIKIWSLSTRRILRTLMQ